MEEELQKFIGQQVPIKTKTGGRLLEYVNDVQPGVAILCTNVDGSGRRTVIAIDSIESFTTGGAGAEDGGGSGAAAAAKPNWKKTE